jgi:hypothetical protein
MSTHLEPKRIDYRDDEVRVNGENLTMDGIPKKWIRCNVEKIEEMNVDNSPTDTYRLLLNPINKNQLPGEGFDIEINVNRDENSTHISRLRFILKPRAPDSDRLDVYDNESESSTLEHFKFDGKV